MSIHHSDWQHAQLNEREYEDSKGKESPMATDRLRKTCWCECDPSCDCGCHVARADARFRIPSNPATSSCEPSDGTSTVGTSDSHSSSTDKLREIAEKLGKESPIGN